MNLSLDHQNPLWGLPWEGASEQGQNNSCQQSDSTFPSHGEGSRHTLQRQGSQPIRFELVRSNSELELEESERAAEYHDYCMYHRIVSGRSSKDIREWLDPNIKDAKHLLEPYHTRPRTDLVGRRDIDLEEKVSTPVLCNTPLTLLDLSYPTPRTILPAREPQRQFSLAEAIRSVESVDDDRSIDEIFDFDP